jgi:uncharacterized membrane protein YciS (DUF1049 family)
MTRQEKLNCVLVSLSVLVLATFLIPVAQIEAQTPSTITTKEELLKSYGKPSEIIDYETARYQVWIYNHSLTKTLKNIPVSFTIENDTVKSFNYLGSNGLYSLSRGMQMMPSRGSPINNDVIEGYPYVTDQSVREVFSEVSKTEDDMPKNSIPGMDPMIP